MRTRHPILFPPAPRPCDPYSTPRDRSGSPHPNPSALRPQRRAPAASESAAGQASTDARHLFDAMPPRKRGGKVKRTAPPGAGRPSLNALPDDVLHHVLSFLPAQEAVRTCVLARRWRHLWKSATGLRILCGNGHDAASVSELREFVYHLLLLRGGSTLDTCVLDLYGYKDEDIPRMELWIRHVLMCKVQVLSLDISRFSIAGDPYLELGNLPFVSQNLKRLKLESQLFSGSFLDFSSCPALEVLEFDDCEFFDCHRISSQCLKFLSFSNCSFDTEFCTYIYAPNLNSLWLEVTEGWTPLLERMPSLVEAVVKIKFSDVSDCGGCGDENCYSCYPLHVDTVDTVVLEGLSEAQSLVLISDIRACIFRRDLKCCPMFSNLKTLSLNEYWCMPDFSSLTCILEHSPILEKLTLQLFCKESKSKVEMKGSPDSTERSNVISEHLKIVEVKCEVVDEKVLNVLKFLSKLSICSFRFQF